MHHLSKSQHGHRAIETGPKMKEFVIVLSDGRELPWIASNKSSAMREFVGLLKGTDTYIVRVEVL